MKIFFILFLNYFLVNISFASRIIQNDSLVNLKVKSFDFGDYPFSDAKKLAYITVSVCLSQSEKNHCYRPVMTSPSFGPLVSSDDITEKDGAIFNVAAQSLVDQYGKGKISYKLDLYEQKLHNLNGGKTDTLITSTFIDNLQNAHFKLADLRGRISISGQILVQ